MPRLFALLLLASPAVYARGMGNPTPARDWWRTKYKLTGEEYN